jgi:hypothetical protein
VYSDGGIVAGTADRILGGVFTVSGAVVDSVHNVGPVTTYGSNDMVLDNWGEVDRWIAEAKVTSHGPSAIGFVNFGSINVLEVRALIETFGEGSRGFNVYDGVVQSAEFEPVVTHANGAVGIQISRPVRRISVKRGILTYGGVGTSLVKGVLTQLPATALSIKPGGSAQVISVSGGLNTRGKGIEPLELHGVLSTKASSTRPRLEPCEPFTAGREAVVDTERLDIDDPQTAMRHFCFAATPLTFLRSKSERHPQTQSQERAPAGHIATRLSRAIAPSISIDGPQRSEREQQSYLPLGGSTIAIEESLNGPFKLLVLPLTGVLEHDRPTSVDDILRGPILIVVRIPGRLFVVLRHGIANAVALNSGLHVFGGLFEGKLGRMDAYHNETLVLISVVKPGDVGQSVDTVVATVCPEIDQDDFAAQVRDIERAGVQPSFDADKVRRSSMSARQCRACASLGVVSAMAEREQAGHAKRSK